MTKSILPGRRGRPGNHPCKQNSDYRADGSPEYDVKMSEIHGMSQRGGSVSSQVRYGDKVMSPVIEKGKADIIVSFEKMEALRNLDYLKPDGVLVVNNEEIPSMSVITGEEDYPEDVLDEIKAHVEARVVDATPHGGRTWK